jgi:hypothetical protein
MGMRMENVKILLQDVHRWQTNHLKVDDTI